MQRTYSFLGTGLLTLAFACSGGTEPGTTIGGGTSGNGNGGTSGGGASGNAGNAGGPPSGGGSGGFIDVGCPPTTCADLGWACGYTVDLCGNVIDCADEGLECADGELCVGGIDGPTQCQAGGADTCELCSAVPECDDVAQPTRLTGRVITPGRDDGNAENQVGVPNAVVYILRSDQIDDLPAIPTGVPTDGQSCDRCEEQDLGPLLAGAITDATGAFTIEGRVPVGREFLLVVKAGKFRRVTTYSLPAEAACQTTALPTQMSTAGDAPEGEGADDNPTRLPRSLTDGLAVNIPKIGISTGRIDAMECVFEKMGISASEFGNPGSSASVQMYRGSGPDGAPQGAKIDDDTPADSELYGSLERLASYDMIVSDCEGTGWDGRTASDHVAFSDRVANGDVIREYVNRGGRLFASHLSMSWLHQNGTEPYDAEDPIATGLAAAADWDTASGASGNLDTEGIGVVSVVGDRPLASPRVDGFASWLVSEAVTSAPDYEMTIADPRSLAIEIHAGTEEFLYRSDPNGRVQQFSFNTPLGAPEAAACGRVAYSGFHVAANAALPNPNTNSPFATAEFPGHCRDQYANDGNLTDQEKVLLYMLFDLGACVGEEPIPPPCVPITCTGSGVQRCGYTPDGCGNVLDCGPCRPPA
jgi:hypothetical protein